MTPPRAAAPSLRQARASRGTLHAGILGIGHYVPDRVLTNAELERMVDTTDEWIRSRTGIVERRLAAPGTATSDLGIRAATAALGQAGLAPTDLDLVIVATTSPDMVCPATACLVQAGIGATRAAAFDLGAACSGFIYALAVAREFVLTGAARHVLVVAAEVISSLVNWRDRTTCVLFGDGAGAAVVGPVEAEGILAICLGANGWQADLLKVPAGGSRRPATVETVQQGLHYLQMSGSEVFKLAVRTMAASAVEVMTKANLTVDDIACFIPHQANTRIIDAVTERLGLPQEKVFLNVQKYGNLAAASTVLALSEAVQQGRVTRGDVVVLVAFGSGLAWGSCALRW